MAQGEKVHTFINSLGWIVADIERTDVIAAIKANDGAELSDEAAHFDHDLVLPIRGRRTFIDTYTSKVKQFTEGKGSHFHHDFMFLAEVDTRRCYSEF